MKNRIKIVLCICLLMIMSTSFIGCEKISNFFNGLISLSAPEVTVVGNTIVWDSVKGAKEYEIYKDDNLVSTTGATYYTSIDNDKAVQFYVVAKSKNGKRKSDQSQKVVVYKQSGFLEEETMNITLKSGVYVIPANICYAVINGSSDNATISIENRSTNLVLVLNSVNMTSVQEKGCITTNDGSYDIQKNRFSVTLVVNGTNILKGSAINSLPPQQPNNAQKKGKTGFDGVSGIVLPAIAITGGGSLTCYGGQGGQGGEGSDSSGSIFSGSLASPGDGGDGGKGGYGIATTKLVMAMDFTGTVNAYGGKGGKEGIYGANGNISTGLWNNILDTLRKGEKGQDGESMVGDILQIGGIYSDQ